MTPAPRLRSYVPVFGAAALLVHQLRYLLAYQDQSAATLREEGHAYLALAGPALCLALATAAALLLHSWAGGVRRPRRPLARRQLWVRTSTALVTVYVAQELIEGFASRGHPESLGGAFGHGGWVAIPLALVIGGIVTAVATTVERVVTTSAPALGLRDARSPLFLDVVLPSAASPGRGDRRRPAVRGPPPHLSL